MDVTQILTPELHMKVEKALREFFREDKDLLCLNVNERSITHKIAEHLQRQFDGLNVDCEYNRYGDDVKRLPVAPEPTRTDCLHAKTVYPDIIVHKRGCDSGNKLVVEVKKSNGGKASHDKNKLRKFTAPNGEYRYELGLFLEFDVGKKAINRAQCFQYGEKIRPCCCCERLSDIFGASVVNATANADECPVFED